MFLIANSGSRQVRTGAVRGGPSVAIASPSLWYVDAARGGTMCIADLTRATLRRTEAGRADTWTITRIRDGKTVPISFAARQNVRSWPISELGLAEGTEYRLTGGDLAAAVTLRFVAVGTPATNPEDVATTLIGKGCAAQLDQMVEAGRPGARTPTG